MGVLDSIKSVTESVGSAFNPVADLVGSGISAFGAYQQQETSKKMAKQQMKFQERMSSTAHQRQVKDLRAAGLNPILSANKGAAAPGGAMGVAQNIGSAAVSALTVRKMYAEVDQIKAATRKIQAETNPVDYIMSNVESLAKLLGTTPDAVRGLIATTAKQAAQGLTIPIRKKRSAFPKYQLRDEYRK